MKVIFYEDNLKSPINKEFRKLLTNNNSKVQLKYAAKLHRFEKYMKNKLFDIFILDVMAPEFIIDKDTNIVVNEIDVGLEIVKRVRTGFYEKQNKNAIIIIRSNRARDLYFISLCKNLGANYVFYPGSNDFKIADIVSDLSEGKL